MHQVSRIIMLSSALLIVAAVFLAVFYRQRKQKMDIFNKMNVPGPKPNFLFGNLLSFIRQPFFIKYQEWYREYGELFGYFEGPSAILVTTNMDLIHEVFVKQFKKFHARKVFPVQVDPERDENVHMFFARGERWRRLRSIVNPAFSSSKMRSMTPMINARIDQLLDVVDSYSVTKKDFDAYDLLQRLTLDTIAECGFGKQSNAIQNPNDEWLANCRGVIRDTTKLPILFLLGFIFPKFHHLWISIYKLLKYVFFNPVFWLEDRMENIVNDRKKAGKASNVDLLELMLNSEFDPKKKTTELEELDANDNVVRKRLLTNEELTSQCLLFLLSGYETTSTTLAYVMYEMAVNQDAQKNLQDEIDRYYPNESDMPTYDTLSKMEYLDMVWCETLRKYPLASTVVARECMESCTVEGHYIEKGMLVHANVWALHYNPDIWGEDPHSFDPQRFSSEKKKNRHPMAWLPFGSGPRSCVGLRLAQLEGKLAIIRLLKKFTFLPSPKLNIPLKCVEGATIIPKDGVPVHVVRRHRGDSS